MPAPTADQLEPLVKELCKANKLEGESADALAAAIAAVIAAGLDGVVQKVQVAPGIACSPAATIAPGSLM